MKKKYVIRDPINGDIQLNETEKKIIDTQNFQFLRKIKQLGLAYLVYPGATNTRFEHSIGVLHITNEISQSLLDEETLQKLRIAGLLHDIGHCAFSHEGEFAAGLNHEKKGLEIIKKSEINDVLKENFSKNDIKQITNFYNGKEFGYLITSAIGSDRIDYLLRDAYYTGVAYGIIDKNRIAQIFKLNNNLSDKKKNNLIYVEENEIEVVESIIIARFMMFMNVYNHKTVRSFSAMLKFAISKAIQEQKISKEDMYCNGDDVILNRLVKSNVEIAKDIINRRLWKKIAVIKYLDFERNFLNKNEKICMKTLNQISSFFSNQLNKEIIVEITPMSYKEPEIKVLTNGKFKELKKLSPIINSLKKAEYSRMKVIFLAKEATYELSNNLLKILKKGY